MHQNCQECTRLWSEFALATRHYLKLEGRLQIAELSHDETTRAELSPMLKNAARERDEIRRQIEIHEAQGQASSAGA
jgi:hypothetical protein